MNISQVFEFNTDDVIRTLEESGRELGDFDGFLKRIDMIIIEPIK